MSFLIKHLYTQPNVAEITIYHKAHTQIDGSFSHGEHDPESISRMYHYATHVTTYGLIKLRLHGQTNI